MFKETWSQGWGCSVWLFCCIQTWGYIPLWRSQRLYLNWNFKEVHLKLKGGQGGFLHAKKWGILPNVVFMVHMFVYECWRMICGSWVYLVPAHSCFCTQRTSLSIQKMLRSWSGSGLLMLAGEYIDAATLEIIPETKNSNSKSNSWPGCECQAAINSRGIFLLSEQ